ncbi:recombination-associated protein RdgC [Aquabacterium sp. J223]|uniref:recombination-associated protein RdgC n=1 Tax=Aquabacterium sp. J223 TaxID=2898431 RepID=UPI0021AD740B|nr:recombination-associated protein RdgC [Aquabacterium sp. J223]UUX94856.1 recombination-associated protein RdgC [Aquabacterium sp. J223]
MFKNALVFSLAVADAAPTLATVEERLQSQRFAGCGPSEAQAMGWVPPRGEPHGPLLESVAGQWLLLLRHERKAVPAGVVREQLEARLDAVERETGRRPRGKRSKELKEEVVHALLPRAFPKTSSHWVWVSLDSGRVVVGAGSPARADALLSLLREALGTGLRIEPLQTQVSPGAAMAEWLTAREAPPGFTIDRDCELRQPDSEKATVRYARHTLDLDEVVAHIAEGKRPTQLAMTWDERVSFVLTEGLALKRIQLLDAALDGHDDDGGFDADAALVTGELSRLLPDLVLALGGEGLPPPAASPAPAASADRPPADAAQDLASVPF